MEKDKLKAEIQDKFQEIYLEIENDSRIDKTRLRISCFYSFLEDVVDKVAEEERREEREKMRKVGQKLIDEAIQDQPECRKMNSCGNFVIGIEVLLESLTDNQ